MKCTEFRDTIQEALHGEPNGMTGSQLRDQLNLPYQRPCSNWTKRLENEIGLTRTKGRALVWKITAVP